MAVALVAMVLPASASAAFGVAAHTITSSNKQAAGHPNVTITVARQGSTSLLTSEGLKHMVLDLPPGLIGDPEAPTSKCSNLSFSWDLCPTASHVGSISVSVIAVGFLPMNVDGTIDVLNASSGSAATLGITLRPLGSQLGLLSKIFQRDEITVRSTGDYGLRNTVSNFPTMATAILIIPVPITVNTISMTLQGKANTSNSGKPFMIQPSLCSAATSTVTLTSVKNVSASKSAPFAAPTGCAGVPFNPTIGMTVNSSTADQYTGGTLTLNVPSAAATIQNSTVDDAAFSMPLGSGLNFPLLSTFTECTEAQLLANACPNSSRLGNATATVPVLPPNFTGGIFAMKIGSEIEAAVRLNGPRNQYAILRGVLKVEGAGANSRVVITAVNNPQFPISALSLTFTQPLIKNPSSCGSQSVTSSIVGHSGATATPSTTFNTADCAPNATISGPEGDINDNTPTYTFSDDQGGGNTYQVSLDGGAFANQTTPYTTPALADGPHSICVRATNGINTGLTVCKDVVVDTVTPTVTITSPTAGQIINAQSVNAQFSFSETAAGSCKIDAGAAVPCDSSTNHAFNGLADGSHTIVVTATDAAGNAGSATRTFTIQSVVVTLPDTAVTGGPRGGLSIDDTTPTFTIASIPAGAPAIQCSIDGGAYSSCAEGSLTLAAQANGNHTLSVRAGDGAGNWDATPATASFTVAPFGPSIDTAYSTTVAASNPDATITVNNPSGDLKDATFSLPDGFWGSRRAVPLCSTANADAGTCPAASQIGTAAFSTRTDDNTAVNFTAAIYMAEGSNGAIARLTTQGLPSVGGTFQANMSFDMRTPLEEGQVINVENPKGLDTVAVNYPSQTSTGVNLHTRTLTLSLVGAGDPDYAAPLLYAPSACDLRSSDGSFVSYENNTGTDSEPFQATNCAAVPFNPSIVQSYSSIVRNVNTIPHVVTTVPANNSSMKDLVVSMPPSIIPQYAGLATFCTIEDTEKTPPLCDEPTTLAGTATADTPLLPNGTLTGKIYLEDSGGTLPYLHIRLNNDALGIEARIRLIVETIPSTPTKPTHLRISGNAFSDSTPASIPDIPLSSLILDLPGTAVNGPISKVSSACRKSDTGTAAINSWAGTTANVTQNFTFDPACPN